jgi:hypothetical protein
MDELALDDIPVLVFYVTTKSQANFQRASLAD